MPTPQPARHAATVIRFSAAALPAAVDLTPYAVRVGNQGQVNSCAAWATDYTALGYWENREGIAGGVLAPMYTYSQIVGGQNTGTTIHSHLDIARSQGVDSWSDYGQGPTDYWDLPSTAEKANAAHWKLTTYQELAIGASAGSTVTQQSIEQALAAGEPVVIGFPVYDNFMYLGAANHGFYAGAGGAYDGGHAVTVLGYDATGVRIENSWGTSWGDGGFATLSWSFVNQYVLEAVAVGQLVASAPPATTPVNTSLPAVSGAAVAGQTLTATIGTWSPAGLSWTIRWQKSTDRTSWSDISGASTLTYTTQASDVGYYIRVVVTESSSGGQASASSAPLGPVVSGPPKNTVSPSISGSARVGQTLTASSGRWSPSGTLAYAWQRSTNGGATWQAIGGATRTSYTITSADTGALLRVRVSATTSGGTGVACSVAVGPVLTSARRLALRVRHARSSAHGRRHVSARTPVAAR